MTLAPQPWGPGPGSPALPAGWWLAAGFQDRKPKAELGPCSALLSRRLLGLWPNAVGGRPRWGLACLSDGRRSYGRVVFVVSKGRKASPRGEMRSPFPHRGNSGSEAAADNEGEAATEKGGPGRVGPGALGTREQHSRRGPFPVGPQHSAGARGPARRRLWSAGPILGLFPLSTPLCPPLTQTCPRFHPRAHSGDSGL